MKTKRPEYIFDADMYIKDIYAVRKRPTGTFRTGYRALNGFVYIESGKVGYEHNGGSFTAEKGTLIYLPFCSAHTFKKLSDDVCYIRHDFKLFDAADGEMTVFGEYPEIYCTDAKPEITAVLDELCNICDAMLPDSKIRANELTLRLLRIAVADRIRGKVSPHGSEIAARCRRIINAEYKSGITVGELCKRLKVSPTHLRRLFKAEENQTVTEYINRCRINCAVHLLKSSDLNMLEIALESGFEEQNYFSRVFKRLIGITPTEFKRTVSETEINGL